MIDDWNYFYSLCKPKVTAKKVKCVKCSKVFKGSTNNKICSKCKRPTGTKNHYVTP